MYETHFGLRETPFRITPDTGYFIASGCYQEAMNTLLIAVRSGEGFIKITGEVGTGKTLLCRKFLAGLDPADYATAYIHNPYLDPHTLLLALADELEIPIEGNPDQHQLLRALTQALIEIGQHRTAVLCLDEAQAMPLETLEALRLLTNLETEKRKLLQVVLFGQPELDERLDQVSVRQIKQRITFQYTLQPCNREETEYYLTHRLSIAGYRGGPLFTRGALNRLYHASQGIPRLINILAHKALLAAYGQRKAQVDDRDIQAAIKDTPSAQPPSRRIRRRLIIGIALALLVGGLATLALYLNKDAPPPTPVLTPLAPPTPLPPAPVLTPLTPPTPIPPAPVLTPLAPQVKRTAPARPAGLPRPPTQLPAQLPILQSPQHQNPVTPGTPAPETPPIQEGVSKP